MKVLAIYNLKGGVGKTAAAVNLSYLSSANGFRTLIWDLDPQGAASYYFRIRPKVKGARRKLVSGKLNLVNRIRGTDFDNLDLLPADFSYRNFDLAFDKFKKSTRRINKLLKPLKKEYDVILLDCPPGISLASENVFYAAEVLLVPVIPSTLSLRAYKRLTKFLTSTSNSLKVRPFLSMVDRRKKLHRMVCESVQQSKKQFFSTTIPFASDVEKMGIERAPLLSYNKNSTASIAYTQLWTEIAQDYVSGAQRKR